MLTKCTYSERKLKGLYKQFGSVKGVAEHLSVPYTTVRYWLVDSRVKMRQNDKEFSFSKDNTVSSA